MANRIIAKLTTEERLLKDLEILRTSAFYPENPKIDRVFNVGDRVIRGAIEEVYIKNIYDDYKYYHLDETLDGNRDNNYEKIKRESIVAWIDLEPFRTLEQDLLFDLE